MAEKFKVLFSCKHNSCRSQMDEAGIGIRKQTPKSIDMYLGGQPMDGIIIVCRQGEAECLHLHPFALHVERWPLADPASDQDGADSMLDAFRYTCDRIENKNEIWLMQHKEQ